MTEELTYQTINKNDERIKEIEKIRSEAFHIAPGDYFKNKIEEEKILAIACYYNNTLVAGAYISQSMNSLFIESVFVKEEYQNNTLHIGHSLLKYILEHKSIAEEFFHTKFTQCRLESKNRDSFYENLGFKEENNIMQTMKKRI